MRHTHPITALALVLATGLAACDGNRDEGGEAVMPTPVATVSATPTASIIRPDVVASPVMDVPPEPLSATVGFPGGGSKLDEAARGKLDLVLGSEQLDEGWPVVLRGHSDSAGHDADNLVVSRRRAEAVADYLVEHGVAEERITVIALGEQNPAVPNAHPDGTPDEDGRATNRRVEIVIAPPPDDAKTGGEADAGAEEESGAAKEAPNGA